MYPIVVGGAFQRFSGIHRAAQFFLSLPIIIGGFLSLLTLNAILFTLLLGLFLMRYLRGLHKILLSKLDRAKRTFVML
jgi:hypothetical protein